MSFVTIVVQSWSLQQIGMCWKQNRPFVYYYWISYVQQYQTIMLDQVYLQFDLNNVVQIWTLINNDSVIIKLNTR